jgi:hypothetical protein
MYVVSHNYSFPFCIERRPDNGSGDDLLVHSKSYSTPSVIRHHYTVTCTGTSTGAVAFGGMNLHESFAASFFRFRFEIDVEKREFEEFEISNSKCENFPPRASFRRQR